jgi:hypothetical protein
MWETTSRSANRALQRKYRATACAHGGSHSRLRATGYHAPLRSRKEARWFAHQLLTQTGFQHKMSIVSKQNCPAFKPWQFWLDTFPASPRSLSTVQRRQMPRRFAGERVPAFGAARPPAPPKNDTAVHPSTRCKINFRSLSYTGVVLTACLGTHGAAIPAAEFYRTGSTR